MAVIDYNKYENYIRVGHTAIIHSPIAQLRKS